MTRGRLPFGYEMAVSILVVVLLAGAAWAQFPAPQAPAQPQAPSSPAENDPRTAQIKAAVEKQGQRVLDVSVIRHVEGHRIWMVATPAAYAQPSWPKVFTQAQAVWWATWGIVSADPGIWIIGNTQVWSRYYISVFVFNQHYAAFLSSYQAARSDDQRREAFDTLLRSTRLIVNDIETGRPVDQKEFISKNFAR